MGCSQWNKQNTLFSFFPGTKGTLVPAKNRKRVFCLFHLLQPIFRSLCDGNLLECIIFDLQRDCWKNIRTYGISFNSYNASICSIRSYVYSTECRSIRSETVDQDKPINCDLKPWKTDFSRKKSVHNNSCPVFPC